MRLSTLCRTVVLALAILTWAIPSTAAVTIVSINYPTDVTVDLPGYGWSRAADTDDINFTVNSASAGDTIYVDTGTYPDTAHEIFSGNWPANNIVVIGPTSSVAEITVTGSGGYAIATPATATGCKVVNMTIRGTVSGARGVTISAATAGPFTLDNIVFDNIGLSIYHSGAGVAADITVTNCRWVNAQSNPALAYVVTQAGATDWTFSNNDFDFSAATQTSGASSALQFTGIANLVFDGNTVTLPTLDQSSYFGVWIARNSTTDAGSPTIIRNTFTLASENSGSFRCIYFGGTNGPAVGATDNIFVAYNTITMPTGMGAAVPNPHYGIEISYASGGTQPYAEDFQIIGNKITGGVNGILAAEGAAKGTVARNWTVGCSNAGIVAKDARRTLFTANVIEDSDRGYYSAFNGVLATNNYGNEITGNLFRRCDAGIKLHGAAWASNDSATVFGGNVFEDCIAPAVQDETALTLAQWQAYTPAGGVKVAGLGSIDLSEEDVTAELRSVYGLPGSGTAPLGVPGLWR